MSVLLAYVGFASVYVALYIMATIQFFKIRNYMQKNYKNLSDTRQQNMVYMPSFWRKIGLPEMSLNQCTLDKEYQKRAKVYNRTLEISYCALGLSIPFATIMALGL